MTAKQPDSKKLYDEYEHALFRMLVHQAAEAEGEDLLALRDRLSHLPESKPSAEALQSFTQQVDAYLRQEHAVDRRKKRMRRLSQVAAVVLAFGVLFFTAMNSVQAFRVRVMNLWLDIRPEFTIFGLRDQGRGGSKQVLDWTNAYVPTYVPEGFSLSEESVRETERSAAFVNGDVYLIYGQYDEFSRQYIDTENPELMKTVDINGHSGTLIYKNGLATVVWDMDAYLFVVHFWGDTDTALKVARGVKFVK